MDGLLFIIAIGAAIFKIIKKAEAESKGQGSSKQKTRQNEWNRQQDSQYRQQELKQRLQAKYNTSQTLKKDEFQVGVAKKGDILSRALENVEETDDDVVLQENHAAVCVDYRTNPPHSMTSHVGHSPDCETFEESDIMQKLNDLMIMGYSGDLEFDRDFVAEGVAMLNSFNSK